MGGEIHTNRGPPPEILRVVADWQARANISNSVIAQGVIIVDPKSVVGYSELLGSSETLGDCLKGLT